MVRAIPNRFCGPVGRCSSRLEVVQILALVRHLHLESLDASFRMPELIRQPFYLASRVLEFAFSCGAALLELCAAVRGLLRSLPPPLSLEPRQYVLAGSADAAGLLVALKDDFLCVLVAAQSATSSVTLIIPVVGDSGTLIADEVVRGIHSDKYK